MKSSLRPLFRDLIPLAAAVLGTVAVVAGVRAADDKAAPAAATPKPALTVAVVQPQPAALPLRIPAHGNVAAWQEASVGAEVNGLRLAEVRANVGDLVKKGDLLAVFASETLAADLAQLRAAVAEAEATLAEASANAGRARELQATGALSAQQIAQYLTGERTAQARLEAQRAALKAQEVRLAQTRVVAPDAGVISARSATVGAVTPAGQELFRLIRQGRLEWRAEVPAAELARLRPGQPVLVGANGNGSGNGSGNSGVPGKVRMVAPTVDAATRNGIVYVDLPNPGALRAGMFARGEFELGMANGLTLPQSAVVLRDGFHYAMRVGADAKVSAVKLEVGRRAGDRIEVLKGLDASAKVVASGGGFLGDGDLVRVVDAPPAPARVDAPATTAKK
jgi:HlyD family secretion protein